MTTTTTSTTKKKERKLLHYLSTFACSAICLWRLSGSFECVLDAVTSSGIAHWKQKYRTFNFDTPHVIDLTKFSHLIFESLLRPVTCSVLTFFQTQLVTQSCFAYRHRKLYLFFCFPRIILDNVTAASVYVAYLTRKLVYRACSDRRANRV